MPVSAEVSSRIPLGLLVFAILILWVSTGCFTTISRPGQTTPQPPSVADTPTPSLTATGALTPVPTLRIEPTPTTTVPVVTPGPVIVTATPAITRDPTDIPGGLMLLVYAPEDGATVPGSDVVVYGQTSPDARVFISGEETEVDAEGGFRANVSLAPAENKVVVVARDDAGQLTRVSRKVTSLALPFLLLVTEPENESIVAVSTLPLRGRTGPNAIVSINGRSVPVDRFGYFSSTVHLDEGPNVIDVVSTNDDGRTLSTVLALIYRAPSN